MNRRESRRQVKSSYKDSLQVTDYSFAMPPNKPIIDRSETMPCDKNDELAEIKRTVTGGLMLFRKKSAAEQEALSQARALKLIERYELSDDRNKELNKNARFKTSSTMAAPLSDAQSESTKETGLSFASSEEQNDIVQMNEPSPNAHEHQKTQQKKGEKSEAVRRTPAKSGNSKPSKISSSFLSRPPLRNKQNNRVNISDDALLKAKALQTANQDEDTDELGVEIVMDLKGNVTLLPSPTGVEAIAPPARGNFYKAPNGRLFDIPNLC
jgi:hypothetical protein